MSIKDRLERLETKNKPTEAAITGFRVICEDDADEHNQRMLKAGHVLVSESNGFRRWQEPTKIEI